VGASEVVELAVDETSAVTDAEGSDVDSGTIKSDTPMTTRGRLVGPAGIVGGGSLALFDDGVAVAGTAAGDVRGEMFVVTVGVVAAVAGAHVREPDKVGCGTGTEVARAVGFTGVAVKVRPSVGVS
jgi:hypothetical protein